MDIKKHQPVIDIPPVVWQVYSRLGASRAEGSQIPKSGMLICVMAKFCPFSVGEIPPHPGHPHQLTVTVLNENRSLGLELLTGRESGKALLESQWSF